MALSDIFGIAGKRKSALEDAIGSLPSQQKKVAKKKAVKTAAKKKVKTAVKAEPSEKAVIKSAFEPSLDFRERRRLMREAERKRLLAEDK